VYDSSVPLEHFTIEDDCGYFRPTGETSLRSLASLALQAMGECKAAGVARLLINARATTQPAITPTDRFGFATTLAESWDRSIKLVIVRRPDQADEGRFGELVGHNRGLNVKGCVSEAEALAWLKAGSS
jgi:hypothetical protein